ncbi:nuclear segregation protein [Seiridium cupressi]|uniref:Nuclear segregation protein n=1 Tax=Seiridium unicorne TaxID=138068 RepID=A0ABR2V1A7_9PEZI
MADVAATPAPAATDKRPPKPDEEAFKKQLAEAEKKHNENMAKFNAIKSKLDSAQPSKNKEEQSPAQKRRAELLAEVQEIRSKQGAGKNARNTKLDQLKRLDEQLKSRITEQKNARGKVNFKSVEDLDREIARLDQQVNGGMMKLVDEKKALTEISNLKKQRKNFAGFDNSQKGIDDLKAKIKELKDSMDDPEQKALSERYTELQTELDKIKAEQDDVYKNLNALRDERSKLYAQQQESWGAIKKIKDDHFAAVRANKAHEQEARARARERQKAERERYDKEKKKERAQKLLQEASDPAYLEEIRRANSLLHFFDPTTFAPEKSPLLANKGLGAEPARKIDDSGFKGMKVVKKDDDDEFIPAKQKGKKSKKTSTPAAPKGGFNCPPSVIEDCSSLSITPPMKAEDVPAAIEEIKKKLTHWKEDQAAQTQRNVDKAKKEIERLEAEEAAESDGVNGDKKVEEVTSDLKDASLEEKQE